MKEHRVVYQVGDQWVAADEGGWTDKVYDTEAEAWDDINGSPRERYGHWTLDCPHCTAGWL